MAYPAPQNPDADYPLHSDVIDLIVPIPPEILAELHCIAVREGVPVACVALSGIEILLGQRRGWGRSNCRHGG